jgi:hypothetical protein
MANTDLIEKLENILHEIIEENLYAESLPDGGCKNALDDFIQDYTPSKDDEAKIKSFGVLLASLVKEDISLDEVMADNSVNMHTFLEGYKPPEEENIIQIDCKIDMAIPKEDLEKNLQLLIDRQGVQWLSTVIESMAEGKAVKNINIEPKSYATVLEYLSTLRLTVFEAEEHIEIGYVSEPLCEDGKPTGFFEVDHGRPIISYGVSGFSRQNLDNQIFEAFEGYPNVFKEVDSDIIQSLLK